MGGGIGRIVGPNHQCLQEGRDRHGRLAALAAVLVACDSQDEPDPPQASTSPTTPSASPAPPPSPVDQLAAFCEDLAPLVDDFRPGGLLLDLSENGYDEAELALHPAFLAYLDSATNSS